MSTLIFPVGIVLAFTGAGIVEAFTGNWPKMWVYLFSAAINIALIWVK